MSTAGDLVRANTTVALGTAVSRITGFIRFALLVALVDGALADSYNTANNLPNQVYELVLGGVLTASIIPLFTEYTDKKDHEAVGVIMGTSLVVALIITIASVALSPFIVLLYTLRTPSSIAVGQFRSVTLLFSVLLLPQVFFYSLTFLVQALLNARRRFFAAAWAPVVNNVVVILAMSSLGSKLKTDRTLAAAAKSNTIVYVLGGATTAGIVLMALFLLPALRQAGIPLKLRVNRKHPAVRQLVRLSVWTVGYTVANQISLFLVTVLARPGSSGVTVYQIAYLIVQLPIGLLAMSVITTFGPELARERMARRRDGLADKLMLGLGAIVGLLLPVGAGLVALNRPLVSVLLEHGNFKNAPPVMLAHTLAGFGVGLFALGGYLFVLRGFFAHNDTRTPFAINVVQNVINIVLAVVLVGSHGVVGLAWAFSISYVIAFALALVSLRNKLGGALPLGRLATSVVRVGIASVVTAEVAWLAGQLFGSDGGAGAYLRLIVGSIAGVAAYLASLVLMDAPELDPVRSLGR